MPLARIEQCADDFGVPPSSFHTQAALGVFGTTGFEPTTMFGWVMSDQRMLGHLGSGVMDRVTVVADSLDWDHSATFRIMAGGGYLTVDEAKEFMKLYLPGVNPVVLNDSVASEPEDEKDHVDDFAGHVGYAVFGDDAYVRSFDDLEEIVAKARTTWEASRSPVDLDDGRPVPEALTRWVQFYR